MSPIALRTKCRSSRRPEHGWYHGGQPSSRADEGFLFARREGRTMADELADLAARARRDIAAAADEAALEALRVRDLGRKDGGPTTPIKSVSALPAAARPPAGAALHRT